MGQIPNPKRGSALGSISLIGGAETDIEGVYNFLYVSAEGNIRVEDLVWNPSALAWEAKTENELTQIRRLLEEILIIMQPKT